MNEVEFLTLVAEILETQSSTLSLSSELDSIDWDSLSNLSFIAEIDSKLNKKIDAQLLEDAATISDLYKLI